MVKRYQVFPGFNVLGLRKMKKLDFIRYILLAIPLYILAILLFVSVFTAFVGGAVLLIFETLCCPNTIILLLDFCYILLMSFIIRNKSFQSHLKNLLAQLRNNF